jgi:branched-subunit amino acid aminotransferase/4-amino-4-deoxychorismate lyase
MTRPPLGLIETVRVRDGIAPLWGLHLNRLYLSCKALGIPHPRELETPEGGDRVHRLLVSAKGTETTERAVAPIEAVRLVTARVAHRSYPHKTTEREPFDAAVAEARAAGADDAILLTREGLVAEAGIWAVCWWEGERVAAPPLALGVLPSVGRERLGQLLGEVLERPVSRAGLERRAPFVVNAVHGPVAIASLDGVPVEPAPALAELRRRFWSVTA